MVSAGAVTEGFVRLRVSPGAKTSSLKGRYGESAVKLSATVPPVDGKANMEVERLLAGLLGAAPSEVAVVRGVSSSDKSVLVRGSSEDEVLGRPGSLL